MLTASKVAEGESHEGDLDNDFCCGAGVYWICRVLVCEHWDDRWWDFRHPVGARKLQIHDRLEGVGQGCQPSQPIQMEISLEDYKADPQSAGALVYVDCNTPNPYYVTNYGKAVVVSHEKSFPNPIFLLAKEVEYWDKGEFHFKFGDRAYWYYVTIGGVAGAIVAFLFIFLVRAVQTTILLIRQETEQLNEEEFEEEGEPT